MYTENSNGPESTHQEQNIVQRSRSLLARMKRAAREATNAGGTPGAEYDILPELPKKSDPGDGSEDTENDATKRVQ